MAVFKVSHNKWSIESFVLSSPPNPCFKPENKTRLLFTLTPICCCNNLLKATAFLLGIFFASSSLSLSLSPIQCTHTQTFSKVTHMLKYPLVGICLSWGLELFFPTFVYLRGYSAHDNDRWPPKNVTSRRYIHRLLPVSHQ